MPAYNFQKQFVPMILDGSKAQTIRRRRKHPTKAGDTLYLYTGLRTKDCRLIGKAICTKVVKPVVIYPFFFFIKINGQLLSTNQMTRLARNDGFRSWVGFFQFFQRYEEKTLLDFEIIEWDPKMLEREWRELANGANVLEVGDGKN